MQSTLGEMDTTIRGMLLLLLVFSGCSGSCWCAVLDFFLLRDIQYACVCDENGTSVTHKYSVRSGNVARAPSVHAAVCEPIAVLFPPPLLIREAYYVTLRCMHFSVGFALWAEMIFVNCAEPVTFFWSSGMMTCIARTLLSTGTAQQPAALLPRFVVRTRAGTSRQESNEPAPVQSGGTNEAELARKTTGVKVRVLGGTAARGNEFFHAVHPHTQVFVCSGHGQVVRCCDHGIVVVGMATTTTVTFIIMVFSIVIFVSSPLRYSCGGSLFQLDVRQQQ
jgi:hypothetical protein